MDTHHHQKRREKVAADKQAGEAKFKEEGKDPPPSTATAAAAATTTAVSASPPSASSSPSHEFSFTISLHSASSTTIPDKTKPPPPSFAIDLSPADDIFFHGHLLPLHLLSHLPVSPRSSTNSLDSFTLPIKELLEDHQNPNKQSNNSSQDQYHSNDSESKGKPKFKPFSLFGLTRWRKGCEEVSYREREEREEKEENKHKRKPRFDVTHVIKRYVRMVRPLLLFKGRRDKIQLRRQPYSFSGNLSTGTSKGKQQQTIFRGRRGEFSAPASMRTSPTNSGLLVATTATLPSSTSDSTMEELQAAIQAAIAHCKNSIAVEEKLK